MLGFCCSWRCIAQTNAYHSPLGFLLEVLLFHVLYWFFNFYMAWDFAYRLIGFVTCAYPVLHSRVYYSPHLPSLILIPFPLSSWFQILSLCVHGLFFFSKWPTMLPRLSAVVFHFSPHVVRGSLWFLFVASILRPFWFCPHNVFLISLSCCSLLCACERLPVLAPVSNEVVASSTIGQTHI